MDEKQVNLNKMTFPQLEELRDRQLLLLKNKHILNRLADKGEQTKKFLEKIEIEIEERKTVLRLQQQMENLDLNSSNNSESSGCKYMEHICNMEKNSKDERFKPFRMMSPKKTSKPIEVPKPTLLIALRESVELQAKQALRTEEEYLRLHYRQTAREIDSESDTEDSSDKEASDAESNVDEEK